MAFLAPLAAAAGGWTIRRLLPWILAAFLGMGLAVSTWVQTQRLQATKEQLQAAETHLRLVDEDARRWKVASDQRDQVIRDQAAQLTRLRADVVAAEKIAAQADETRQRQIADLDTQLRQLKAKAHAHPDQVRPLGPIALDVLSRLRRGADDVAAGVDADPGDH